MNIQTMIDPCLHTQKRLPRLGTLAFYGTCAINCTNDREVYSFHSGGANAVFADGSVHFLKVGLDIRVLAALVTRAGGELVSADDF
jgi:prepilin-type processing-associated H-X9-DG protein